MRLQQLVLASALASSSLVWSAPSTAAPMVAPANGGGSVPAIISSIETVPFGTALAVSDDDTVYVTGFTEDDSTAYLTEIPPGTLSGTFAGQVLWQDDSAFIPIHLDRRDDTILVIGWEIGGAFVSAQRSLQFSILDDTVAPWSEFDLTGFGGVGAALASDGCSAVYPNAFGLPLYEQCGGAGGYPVTSGPTSAAVITNDDTVYIVGDDSVQTFTLDDTSNVSTVGSVANCSSLGDLSLYLGAALMDDSVYYVSDCDGAFGGTSSLGIIDSTSGSAAGTLALGEWLPVSINAGIGRLLVPGLSSFSDIALHLVTLSGDITRIAGPDGYEVLNAVETSNGLVYAGFYDEGAPTQVGVIDEVSSTSAAGTGVSGDEVPLTLTTATGSSWSDAMVESITFGGRPSAFTRSGNTVTATVPSVGTCTIVAPLRCQASVVINLRGGNSLSVGTFSYALPPIPPGAPEKVTGTAGDREAIIAWSPPGSEGSFPVSTFQAVVSPGGQSCLVASSPCTITGLTNGTEYTVQVRALSGAGWGVFSSSSAPFTPEAPPVEKSILITGSRGEVRGRPGIIISGSSTGMAGEQVAPWTKFPGQTGYAEGSARPTIDAQGDFTWQRRTGKKIYVYFRSVDSDVKSNRVIIAAR